MKTYPVILNNKDDGEVALDLFEHGLPMSVYTAKIDDCNVGVGWLFLNLMRLEGAIVNDGFRSIFDQALLPWELEDHEKFLCRIGAFDFLEHFQECRRIYFSSGELPSNNEEWSSFKPEALENTQFGIHADMAEKAYHYKVTDK